MPRSSSRSLSNRSAHRITSSPSRQIFINLTSLPWADGLDRSIPATFYSEVEHSGEHYISMNLENSVDSRPSLKDQASHFAFGDNWASYAREIDEERIGEAQRGLVRLLGEDGLRGRTFLDIGCGSGIHALAAGRLGAARVVAIDIDPASVETTRALLQRHMPGLVRDVRLLSIFDLSPQSFGLFDVVYSWGVLHHSGAMEEAIDRAARVVAPGGQLAFALYRKTRLCGFWAHEKRWYSRATPRAQKLAQDIYVAAMRVGFWITRRDFAAYIAGYDVKRGMDFWHDVHDWLGGYPYESISPDRVDILMKQSGFQHVRSFTQRQSLGIFGSGCDEYVYCRS
jgi:2-polyprenyl-3-methyl-5-hydroxy-6-metoxy-1,4-benzoquinol methylase